MHVLRTADCREVRGQGSEFGIWGFWGSGYCAAQAVGGFQFLFSWVSCVPVWFGGCRFGGLHL